MNNYSGYNQAQKKPIDEKTAIFLADRLIQSGMSIPKDYDLEQVVLGTILLEPDIQDDAIDLIITPEIFYEPQHQVIYSVFQSMYEAHRKIDIATIVNELRVREKLEEIGGAIYISNLSVRVGTSIHFNDHVQALKNLYIRRAIIKHAMRGIQDAYHADNIHPVLSNFSEMFDEVDTLMAGRKEILSAKQLADNALKRLDTRIAKRKQKQLTGCPTGLIELDKITNGWQNGDFIVWGARPAMGKTALLCYNARVAAMEGWLPIVVSIEMRDEQLADRSILGLLPYEFPSYKFRDGNVSDQEIQMIIAAADKFSCLEIIVDDRSIINIHEIKSLVRRIIKERKKKIAEQKKVTIDQIAHEDIKVICFVDYLQIVDVPEKKGVREQEVSYIARGLKGIAKEALIPVVALAQLGRALESRLDKRPSLSDLRESGSIEQEADVVGFIHRPEYYGLITDEQGNDLRGVGEFILAKHRNGKISVNGDLIFGYNESITSIRDPSKSDDVMPIEGSVNNPNAGLSANTGFLGGVKNFYEVDKDDDQISNPPITTSTDNTIDEEPF